MQGNIYDALLKEIHRGNKCIMLTHLDFFDEKSGLISQKYVLTEDAAKDNLCSMTQAVYDKARLSLDTGRLQLLYTQEDKAILIEPFFPRPRLLIFGGGHIAVPLTEFAARLGFSVTLIDDRPYFANSQRFPQADSVLCESFEKSFDLLDFRKTDFVVIITRGHRHDGIVLRKIIKHELAYIGMIGSRRRVNAMKEALTSEGYDKTRLDNVNAPIGIDISAVTPEEIAISIVAQLILYRNKGIVDRYGKELYYPEFDVEVSSGIFQNQLVPKALITILSSKGSVPRKAGAKMLTYYDGRTIGSIGGGCSEASILTKAKDMIQSNGFQIERIDMTGDAAEEEGMVCGGIMEVLLEKL